MLREGWDVQNVTVVVGLRPYTAKANILPEQTIGSWHCLSHPYAPVRSHLATSGPPSRASVGSRVASDARVGWLTSGDIPRTLGQAAAISLDATLRGLRWC
jgi:hypothetical protein